MSEKILQLNLKKLSNALINGLNKGTGEKWKVAILKSGHYIQKNVDHYVSVDIELDLVAIVAEDLVIKGLDYISKIGTKVIPLEIFKDSSSWEKCEKDILSKYPSAMRYKNSHSIYGFKLCELFNIKTDKYYFAYSLAKEEIDNLIKEEKKQQRIRAIVYKQSEIKHSKNIISEAKKVIRTEQKNINKLEQEISDYKVIKDDELKI